MKAIVTVIGRDKVGITAAVCALLGGGGHAAASGCTVHGSVEEAKRAILEAIEKVKSDS